jgi:hypothetical protein
MARTAKKTAARRPAKKTAARPAARPTASASTGAVHDLAGGLKSLLGAVEGEV